MDGILLNKKIGIIGGRITGLIVGIFLAKEGHKVSIFEKNTLLSETSSKTTKLLHGGLRYLENFHKSSRDYFIQENDSLLTIFGGKWTTSPTIARKSVTMI